MFNLEKLELPNLGYRGLEADLTEEEQVMLKGSSFSFSMARMASPAWNAGTCIAPPSSW